MSPQLFEGNCRMSHRLALSADILRDYLQAAGKAFNKLPDGGEVDVESGRRKLQLGDRDH
jgi:hypothetical protein